ncbi:MULTISPECIES: GNAT family N-acetyltransferase [Streptococcus]|uniref:GNAT family N-acetyltransferase n=1 Tax=Streptococcus zhangguiae TaxID=2664091 RepID=A0A6I4RHD5_9STRE|nr:MULTISPECIES: GNAT family N-acetyltransferase [unclassified Streptococcus]MWV55863.1 GNAT family N-acetyltransferase [Streptococcus sp. zg-70]QTH48665.1 GNAT family N-acetyltransferase [Streptococcus sp. zg-86]
MTLARAYAYRTLASKTRFIYQDLVPIGLFLYYDVPSENAYVLAEFFIGDSYQGKSYGTQALKMLLKQLKDEKRYPYLRLFYIKTNQAAKQFYEKETGMKMRLSWNISFII